jgi:hypothetical protein
MRSAAIIVLCFAAIKLLAQPDNSATKRKNNSADQASNTVALNNNDESETQANASDSSSPHWYTALERPDWWLVGIAFLTGLAIAYQAREMTRATNVMQGQMTEMRRQVDLAFGQLRAMHEQITQMSEQTGLLGQYVQATNDGVEVARKSADAAKRGVEIVISKERARIRIDPGELEIKCVADKFWFASVDIKVSNLGAMKALPYSTQQVLFLSHSSEPIKKSIPGSLIDDPVILPDQTFHRKANCIFEVVPETIKNLNEQSVFMHLYGAVHYTDVFGSYVTTFRYIWKASYAGITGGMFGTKIDTTTALYGGWEKHGTESDNTET